MRVVISIDSFKGSLSSLEAGEAVRTGILRSHPDARITVLPLADGGEGTVDALIAGLNGAPVTITVSGPLGEPVTAVYGRKDDLAIMEMASAAGLPQVPAEKRDGLHTTTFGVGQMIAHALRTGCRRFLMGIGGSATTDGGMGMLQALGYSFTDEDGRQVGPGAVNLGRVRHINADHVLPELAEASFSIACDVSNPLYGPQGAAAIYGPQKGLTPQSVITVDQGMQSYAGCCAAFTGKDMSRMPGAGAAGGLGYGFITFLNARLNSGVDLVLDTIGLDDALCGADIVITGEGRLDAQTAMGKGPGGVAARAKQHGCRVIAFAGCVTDDARTSNAHGIDAFFPILRTPCTVAEAMDKKNAAHNLTDTAEQVFRLL